MKNSRILFLTSAWLLCMLLVNPLLAQQTNEELKKLNKPKLIELINELTGQKDSLQAEVDSLNTIIARTGNQPTISGTPSPNKTPIQSSTEALLKKENDSLRKLVEEQYINIYRGGYVLLDGKYYSGYEKYIDMLKGISDSQRQSLSYGMWKELENLIMKSNTAPIEIRQKVLDMVVNLPTGILQKEEFDMIDLVFNGVDKEMYNPIQHTIALLKSIPDDVKVYRDELINTLSDYKQSNEEILTALKTKGTAQSILNKIKETGYYKNYYTQKNKIRIYYLDEVIDMAIKRLQNGNTNLQDLIEKLK